MELNTDDKWIKPELSISGAIQMRTFYKEFSPARHILFKQVFTPLQVSVMSAAFIGTINSAVPWSVPKKALCTGLTSAKAAQVLYSTEQFLNLCMNSEFLDLPRQVLHVPSSASFSEEAELQGKEQHSSCFTWPALQLTKLSSLTWTYQKCYLLLFPFSSLQNTQLPEKEHYRLRYCSDERKTQEIWSWITILRWDISKSMVSVSSSREGDVQTNQYQTALEKRLWDWKWCNSWTQSNDLHLSNPFWKEDFAWQSSPNYFMWYKVGAN